jgi:hypothetical protein
MIDVNQPSFQIHTVLTQGVRRKTKLARERNQSRLDSTVCWGHFGKRWATSEDLSVLS